MRSRDILILAFSIWGSVVAGLIFIVTSFVILMIPGMLIAYAIAETLSANALQKADMLVGISGIFLPLAILVILQWMTTRYTLHKCNIRETRGILLKVAISTIIYALIMLGTTHILKTIVDVHLFKVWLGITVLLFLPITMSEIQRQR